MATAKPPADNELVDQEAVHWLIDNNELVMAANTVAPDLGGSRYVWNVKDFEDHIQGSTFNLPNNRVPNWSQVKGFRDTSLPVWNNASFPNNWSATDDPSLSSARIRLSWTNPTHARGRNWEVLIYRCHNTLSCTPTTLIASVNVGSNTNQNYWDSTVQVGPNYRYRARYRDKNTGQVGETYTATLNQMATAPGGMD
jgi:hypothetical protein